VEGTWLERSRGDGNRVPRLDTTLYGEVASWAATLGWLRLAFLRFNEQPIAFQFDLESGRTYYSLKIGYDPEFERFPP
jgi:CelD/BcsL family acetyltransferase involved in cellulose biosynthesis